MKSTTIAPLVSMAITLAAVAPSAVSAASVVKPKKVVGGNQPRTLRGNRVSRRVQQRRMPSKGSKGSEEEEPTCCELLDTLLELNNACSSAIRDYDVFQLSQAETLGCDETDLSLSPSGKGGKGSKSEEEEDPLDILAEAYMDAQEEFEDFETTFSEEIMACGVDTTFLDSLTSYNGDCSAYEIDETTGAVSLATATE